MNVTRTIRAARDDENFISLEKATDLLKEVLGRPAENVKGEWDKVTGARGNPIYVLRLSDGLGEAAAEFTPGEMRDTAELRRRLRWLWGDVLEDRSHRQLKALVSAEDTQGD